MANMIEVLLLLSAVAIVVVSVWGFVTGEFYNRITQACFAVFMLVLLVRM
ncbi:hypothetical protein [Ectobacillus ponti]|uniref:Uncharacterized protein n=1 Tax=Ectobacillus ponti TaxID=2961894 RepID=A0AA41X7E5_9BACI|nr:hypothetical protein [Ectobacillus ponti]MCP8970117.1 hypothetical protein [Ectobacillus ponti]